MKRVLQIMMLLLAIGAIIQTIGQAVKKPLSAQQSGEPAPVILAQSVPGV